MPCDICVIEVSLASFRFRIKLAERIQMICQWPGVKCEIKCLL